MLAFALRYKNVLTIIGLMVMTGLFSTFAPPEVSQAQGTCALNGFKFSDPGTHTTIGWYRDGNPKRRISLSVNVADCAGKNIKIDIFNDAGGPNGTTGANPPRMKLHTLSYDVPANSNGSGEIVYSFDLGEEGCSQAVTTGQHCHLFAQGFVDGAGLGGFDSYSQTITAGGPDGVVGYMCDPTSSGIVCGQAFNFPAAPVPSWIGQSNTGNSTLSFGEEFRKLTNPIEADSIQEVIRKLIKIVFVIGVPLVALAIIYSGFLLVTAGGSTEKLKKGKDALFAAVIGGAILLGAWVIAEAVKGTVDEIRGSSS